MFIQERYGRFNLNDPFLALQRDYEAGASDKEKMPVCTNPLSILEAVMAHCRKMQERMSAQLAAAEGRQKKVLDPRPVISPRTPCRRAPLNLAFVVKYCIFKQICDKSLEI